MKAEQTIFRQFIGHDVAQCFQCITDNFCITPAINHTQRIVILKPCGEWGVDNDDLHLGVFRDVNFLQ